MSDADLDRKFLDLADGVLLPARARQVLDLCRGIDGLASASDLASAAAVR
jgi:hypothetical protein